MTQLRASMAAVTLATVTCFAHSAEMKCIPAPAAATKDLKADVALKVAGLKRLIDSAEFSAQAGVITNDLYSKYPNADKLVTVQALLSQVCSLLNSVSISDEKKVAKYSETEMLVYKIVTASPPAPTSSSTK